MKANRNRTFDHRFPARWLLVWLVVMVALVATACNAASANYPTTVPSAAIPTEIPPLPFASNYDPTLCGIPEQVNFTTTVTGEYNGELIQPIIYLYDSHLRNAITGQLFPGTRVKVELSQTNPALNYYFVRTIDLDPPQSGWIPEPFLILPDRS
jgi:hypothetical protein